MCGQKAWGRGALCCNLELPCSLVKVRHAGPGTGPLLLIAVFMPKQHPALPTSHDESKPSSYSRTAPASEQSPQLLSGAKLEAELCLHESCCASRIKEQLGEVARTQKQEHTRPF